MVTEYNYPNSQSMIFRIMFFDCTFLIQVYSATKVAKSVWMKVLILLIHFVPNKLQFLYITIIMRFYIIYHDYRGITTRQ